MNVTRFFGKTNKEALAKVRERLGPDAIVLKNQPVDGGVEILAMADTGRGIHEGDQLRLPVRPASAPAGAAPTAGEGGLAEAGVPEMNTLSFQQYVRDRLARRIAEGAPSGEGSMATGLEGDPATLTMGGSAARPTRRAQATALADSDSRASAARVTPRPAARPAPVAAPLAPAAPAPAPAAAMARPAHLARPAPADISPAVLADALGDARESITESIQQSVMAELRQMKEFIAGQLESLSWFESTRRQPVRNRLLKSLLVAGFSPTLARALVERLPEGCDDTQAASWLRKALVRNLRCDPSGSLIEGGGVFALVGPTGVGKTTSTAKIAARFALRHGTQSIGLITVDAYRIGGQDQLRSFGRMLGVPVHVAHDAPSLNDFLQLYQSKKLVLIDTAGISQRDERVDDMLDSLDGQSVSRLLVVNAATQVETMEEVVQAYRGHQSAGLIISKMDEAVRPAAALDCAVRHKMRVLGIADGQRVPEDWHWADPRALVERALAAQSTPTFEMDEQMLGMMFASTSAARRQPAGRRADV